MIHHIAGVSIQFTNLVNYLPTSYLPTSRGWQEEGGNNINEPVHEISNNVVCAASKASDQPAHTRSLIRAFASRLSIL